MSCHLQFCLCADTLSWGGPGPSCNNYYEGVTVSAWEGSKFQEAVEDEKKFGRKRPEAKPVIKAPPLPKYDVGDVLCYSATNHVKMGSCTFIEIERKERGGPWVVHYRIGNKWVTEGEVTGHLVEAP